MPYLTLNTDIESHYLTLNMRSKQKNLYEFPLNVFSRLDFGSYLAYICSSFSSRKYLNASVKFSKPCFVSIYLHDNNSIFAPSKIITCISCPVVIQYIVKCFFTRNSFELRAGLPLCSLMSAWVHGLFKVKRNKRCNMG